MGFKLDKLFSGRFLATTMLTFTYCLIVSGVAYTGCRLLMGGKDTGEKIITFIVGNMTGTAMGAIIGYFFRTDRTPKGGA